MSINSENKYYQIDWLRLDNAATIYSLVTSKRIPGLFRVSVTLKDPVKIKFLRQALDNLMSRFPYYNVNVRPGIFWNYLNHNPNSVPIYPEVKYPCQKLPVFRKGVHPFRVIAYRNRIALEFSHMLSDGTGAITFLRSIVGEYFALQGFEVKDWKGIIRPDDPIEPEEYEDSYKRYFKREVPFKPRMEKAFHLPDKILKKGVYLIISGKMDVKQVLKKAKSYGASLTEYLVAIYLEALQDIYENLKTNLKRRLTKPIRVMVPVNLRKILPSKTLRNFSLFVTPGIDPRLGHYSFEEIIKAVHHYMRYEVNDKFINQQIARNVKGEFHPLVRMAPLFIKKLFGTFIYNTMGENLYSGIVTNLGRVEMPEEIADEIEYFEFVPAPGPVTKTAAAVVSYRNTLVINFGRVTEYPIVEQKFFRKLVKEGIKVKIDSN
ncbi:MAG: hypothetical protein ACTSYD_13870 [Candidatus Heimdallarchaeaceae archaeon]